MIGELPTMNSNVRQYNNRGNDKENKNESANNLVINENAIYSQYFNVKCWK